MLRNRLAMYIASQLGMEYTPKMLPVDLVIDGKYMGSYYLSELVRVGKNRVDIDELTPDDNEEPNITGGYLLAIEPAWSTKPAHPENTVTTSRNESFSFESPEFYSEDEDDVLGTEQQKEYIENYLKETEEAIFGQDFKNSDGVSYTEDLDAQSAADFWWLQEFTVNSDAFTTSSNYLYKKRDGKLYFCLGFRLLNGTSRLRNIQFQSISLFMAYIPQSIQLGLSTAFKRPLESV